MAYSRNRVSTRGTVDSLLQRSIVSRTYKPGSRKGVITLGGLSGNVDTMSGIAIGDVTDAGFPTISCAVDATWGNSTMMDRLDTLYANSQESLFAPSKVHMYAVSMGGLCALNWAKANPTLVQSIVLVVPALNPQRIYDDNTASLQASISTAWGGRPPDSATPVLNTDHFVGIPIQIYYSRGDQINTEPADTEDFAEAVEADLVDMGDSTGHAFGPPLSVDGVDSNVPIAEFFTANDADTLGPAPFNNKGISVGGVFAEQSEADQDDDLDAIVDLDSGWIRIDINWAVVQRDGSTSYDWYMDHAIEGALSRGLKVLAAPVYTPGWHKADSHVYPDASAFRTFCTAAANRYSPQGVSHWEIWNEPNITGGFLTPNANSYRNRCLIPGYQAIKEVDPDATVLHGGLANTDNDGVNIDPYTYFGQMYFYGANDYFDAGNFHPYTQPSVPGGGESWNPWTKMVNARAVMVSQGESNKQIWVTESGAATDGDPVKPETFTTETQQALIVATGFTEAEELGWVGPVFTYMHRDKTDQPGSATHTREDFFGLLYYDRTEKPAADEFRTANGNW